MRITLAPAASLPDDLVVTILTPDAPPPEGISEVAAKDASSEAVLLYSETGRRALLGLGKDSDEGERLREVGEKAARLAGRVKARTVAIEAPPGLGADGAAALVEGFILGGYRFTEYKTSEDETPRVDALTLAGVAGDDVAQAVEAAQIRAEATCFARDLVNRSPHDKTAPRLADAACQMAREFGLRCEVWERQRIEAERMGGLLAVSRGSVEPPRFVVLEHKPDGITDPPIVLVGKAVVFDTGGLSLKSTSNSMDKMKADMAGGAAVMGTLQAVARMDLPLHVVGLIPLTDNRPGGDAYVPGDIVTMRNGLTVEVLNTDAEGRMIVADALDYAKTFDPALVIDIATLTGSSVIALGFRVAAAMTSEDDNTAGRVAALTAAGLRTGEWIHQLPMHAHYAEQLKSDVADMTNLGGRGGGAIVAGKFLERFTQDSDGRPAYPWIHLDIAGQAFPDNPQPYRPAGATGFGVRLLTDFLQHWARREF
jgi:leucyl aminopeptidase